ncbi:MAG: hypothetical protein LBS24_07355 [Clostridiales Family XIII bacterium]|jgi:hypothetical protein|nr:hypothetical protein [Clostridiales Family XIII bacterium]
MHGAKRYENKAEIKRDIRAALATEAGVLCVGQVARYLGVHRNSVMKLMEGYEYVRLGHRKAFTADDLADRILRDRETVL